MQIIRMVCSSQSYVCIYCGKCINNKVLAGHIQSVVSIPVYVCNQFDLWIVYNLRFCPSNQFSTIVYLIDSLIKVTLAVWQIWIHTICIGVRIRNANIRTHESLGLDGNEKDWKIRRTRVSDTESEDPISVTINLILFLVCMPGQAKCRCGIQIIIKCQTVYLGTIFILFYFCRREVLFSNH